MSGQDAQAQEDKEKESCSSCVSMLDQLIEQGAALIVEKEQLAANEDYDLSGERYRGPGNIRTQFELAPLGRFAARKVASLDPRKFPHEVFELWSIPAFDSGAPEICEGEVIGSQKKCVEPGDVLLSRIIPHIRRAWVVKTPDSPRRQIASTEWMVFRTDEIIPGYLRHVLVSDPFHAQFMQTVSGVGGSLSRARPDAVKEIEIPLPPLQVQQEIVAEIEGYQRVIDGARAVVESYRPQIVVDPEWPLVELGEVCVVERGASPRPIREFTTESPDGVNWVKIGDAEIGSKFITKTEERITPDGASRSRWVRPGDFILSNSMSFGRPYIMAIEGCIHDGWLLLREQSDLINQDFLYHILGSKHVYAQFQRAATGGVVKNLNSKIVRGVKIPVPPVDVQKTVADEIEAEQALVAANRELIERFERKIAAAIGRVWGEDALTPSKV